MISEKINKSKEKPKKETFIQAVVTLIFSQVLNICSNVCDLAVVLTLCLPLK